MKISLHIEADTAVEFQTALDFFQAQARTLIAQEPEPAPKPAPQPIPPQPEPQEPKPAPEPDEDEIPPVVAQEPAQARRQRGRPRKEKPTKAPVEAPVAAPVAAADVAKIKEADIELLRRTEAQYREADIEVASRQDLLDVFSEYVQRYGAAFGFTDISTLLQQHLGDGVRKASDVPEQQLTQAIGAIRQAIAENPFNRKRDYNA